MKKRLIAVLLTAVLVLGGIGTYSVNAASDTKVVTDQKGLNKALKSRCRFIEIKTGDKLDLTIDHKDYGDKVLTINGSQLTLTNGGHFKSIKISNADKVTEEGTDNTITVADKKIELVVAKCASVAAIDLIRKGTRVDITVDGSLTEVNVEKKADLKLLGKTDTAVKVVNNASGTSVSCKIKTDLVANQEMSVNFATKRAAHSTVETNADIDIKASKYVPLESVTVSAEGVNVNIDTDAEIISVNVKEIAKVNLTGDGNATVIVDDKAVEAEIVSSLVKTIGYIFDGATGQNKPSSEDGLKNLFELIRGIH